MTEAIRSVQRALMLLRLMNKRDTWMLKQVAEESGLAKATAFRLLQTLHEEGYVHLSPKRPGVYRLSSTVRELGAGLTSFTLYADLAEPIVISTTRSTGWPVSFAMPSAPFMRIVSCGMPFSPEHSAKPTSVGREHWMFSSAVGAAYLSRCTQSEVEASLRAALSVNRLDGAMALPTIEALLATLSTVRMAGYSLRIANGADVNSAMAVPVVRDEEVIGAIACSTFPRSLSQDFVRRLLPTLTDAAAVIARACSDGAVDAGGHPLGDAAFPAGDAGRG